MSSSVQSVQTILEIGVDSSSEEVKISERLLKDYQELNDKLEKTIKKINHRKKLKTKK